MCCQILFDVFMRARPLSASHISTLAEPHPPISMHTSLTTSQNTENTHFLISSMLLRHTNIPARHMNTHRHTCTSSPVHLKTSKIFYVSLDQCEILGHSSYTSSHYLVQYSTRLADLDFVTIFDDFRCCQV